jgi:hypothetical protein
MATTAVLVAAHVALRKARPWRGPIRRRYIARCRPAFSNHVELALTEEAIAGALGAPLPLDAELAEIHLELVEARRRGHAVTRAKLGDALVLGRPG